MWWRLQLNSEKETLTPFRDNHLHLFQVIIALPADKFGSWEQKQFAPEEEFLACLKAIGGLSTVETQTYTIMPVM